jgi:photoprotection regulator FRP-like protein
MTSPSNLPYQNHNAHQPDLRWSRSEKAIARNAFDAALGQELHELIQEAKRMASEIQKSSALWALEHHLTQRRKEIDRKYDFRDSRLMDVLGRLLYENRLGEEDLRGLGEEKMKSVRSFAQFLREGAA